MHHDYQQKIAATLRDARLSSKLSLRKLAKVAGTSHSTLVTYEQGRKTPTVATFLRLLDCCGFATEFALTRRIRGTISHPRGQEFEQALALAERFPTPSTAKLAYPPFHTNSHPA